MSSLTCWLLGHQRHINHWEKDGHTTSYGEKRPKPVYLCSRCSTTEPDPRNLYQRTISWKIMRERNRWYGWRIEFQRKLKNFDQHMIYTLKKVSQKKMGWTLRGRIALLGWKFGRIMYKADAHFLAALPRLQKINAGEF